MSVEMPLTLLTLSEFTMERVLEHIHKGAPSRSEGPVWVCCLIDYRQYVVDDGNHRIGQAILDGAASLPAMLWSGHSWEVTPIAPVSRGDIYPNNPLLPGGQKDLLRETYDGQEPAEPTQEDRPRPACHRAWYDAVLLERNRIPGRIHSGGMHESRHHARHRWRTVQLERPSAQGRHSGRDCPLPGMWWVGPLRLVIISVGQTYPKRQETQNNKRSI